MSHYFTNENIASNLSKISVKINDKSFTFFTDNGIFSKKGLDFGSRSLLNSLLKEPISGNGLDVGCGNGAIGIILSSFFHIQMDMIDVNKRALHLAARNVKEQKLENINIFESNVYENVTKKYDFIVTNPPIRAGKEIVYKILFLAKDYLKKNGVLYFVVNKDQGAKSAIRDLEKISSVEVLDKSKGFYIVKVKFD